jgi:hypothetical protein
MNYDFDDIQTKRWFLENAAGEHDDECEQRPGFYFCHCSKRRREDEGLVEPLNLVFTPSCPHCYVEVFHNGDGFECKDCAIMWDNDGEYPEFQDDHGDLKSFIDRWTHVQRIQGRR